MPKTRRKNQPLAERATPIRKILQDLIHRKVKTKTEREALAKFLNQEISSVNSMIYSGEGGLDSWIGALAFCYKLEAQDIEKLFADFNKFMRKNHPLTKADELYAEISEKFSADQLALLLSLINESADLSRGKGKGER